MMGFSRVIAVGNLVRDPEMKTLPSGQTVSDLVLAASERYTNKEGQQVERALFVDVVVWGRQAQVCQEFLAKGAPVLVEGRLQQDRWETPEGKPRTKLRIRADNVRFLPRVRPDGEAAKD